MKMSAINFKLFIVTNVTDTLIEDSHKISHDIINRIFKTAPLTFTPIRFHLQIESTFSVVVAILEDFRYTSKDNI